MCTIKFLFFILAAAMSLSCSSTPNSSSSKNSEVPISAPQPEIQLKLISSTGGIQSVGLEQLKKELAITTLTVNANPAYKGAKKQYDGFDLVAIVQKMEPSLNVSKKPFWIEVTTLDGWKAPAYSSKLLLKGKALLAIRETPNTTIAPVSEDGLWSLVVTPKKTLSPGPFYLVWNDKGKNPDVMPLQVASIQISLKNPKHRK